MWRSGGLRWGTGGPCLLWEGRGRASALVYGGGIGFRVAAGGERTCVGARGNRCPVTARVAGRSAQARCAECARLDRAHSVAADTRADDPQVYRVYLAWFGAGMVKVGITAEARGPARLMEQGAVAFSWLGRGPLMAARRTEELLRTALGVPDRIPYASKRAVRAGLPPRAVREAEVREVHGRALALPGWPGSLERMALHVVDHTGAFGLEGLPEATAVVTELVAGGTVAGRLVAAAGPDLHLTGEDGELTVFDTRLMAGWDVTGAEPHTGVTVPVRAVVTAPQVRQEGLFGSEDSTDGLSQEFHR
ncbi:DUF2797 domain-containing protein [Streptomyces sp. NBC_00344]|uniref:DUF2797 domain-containing protein n=1 Tax=Streptomyces sp. NBC_00344 TaxID=2975720 RepID=UPI002E1C2565